MVVEIRDFGFETVDSDRMYALLNQALQEITNKRPWAWREATTTLTFSGSSASPSNASFPVSSMIALTDPSTGNILNPVSRQSYQKRYAQTLSDTGSPLFYYFDGHTLKVWRVPGASQTLTANYLAYQAAVTSSSAEADMLIIPRFHWIVIYLVLSRLYWKDDDLEMAQFAKAESERLELLMVNEDEMRTGYDRPMLMDIFESDSYDDFYN